MIYDFVVKYSEANFKIIDILFSVLLFVVTIISWIITKKYKLWKTINVINIVFPLVKQYLFLQSDKHQKGETGGFC